ncbi:MAG: hypothetical protein IJA05_07145 [Oscillospiraceae bacterium]|nr:hypothetical protein [Oscillospiraceae bacterium]
MKRFLMVVLLLCLCGCASGEPEIDPELFTAEIISFDEKSISFFVVNNSKNTVEIGNEYYLEKKEGKSWTLVPETEEVFFTAIAYGLNPGEAKTFEENLEMRYGVLEKGIYRISKDIWIWNEDEVICGNQRIFAEFEIKQGGKVK